MQQDNGAHELTGAVTACMHETHCMHAWDPHMAEGRQNPSVDGGESHQVLSLTMELLAADGYWEEVSFLQRGGSWEATPLVNGLCARTYWLHEADAMD